MTCLKLAKPWGNESIHRPAPVQNFFWPKKMEATEERFRWYRPAKFSFWPEKFTKRFSFGGGRVRLSLLWNPWKCKSCFSNRALVKAIFEALKYLQIKWFWGPKIGLDWNPLTKALFNYYPRQGKLQRRANLQGQKPSRQKIKPLKILWAENNLSKQAQQYREQEKHQGPKLRQEKRTQAQTLWSRYLRAGRGSSTWRVGGAKKFGMSFETQENEFFVDVSLREVAPRASSRW